MKKYYFFDRGILDPQGMDNVELRINPAIKDEKHNPLFTEGAYDSPQMSGEVRIDNGYPNIIYDEQAGIYRCYYTAFSYDRDSSETPKEEKRTREYKPEGSRITSLFYAESKDGIHWIKPMLHKVDLGDGGKNNIMIHYAHGTGVLLDKEESNPDKRYKLVTKVEYSGGYNYMAVSYSPDGINWCDMIRWPKYNPPADSHNFLFRDKKDGRFKVITRIWQNGLRLSAICESEDFINWSEPREIIRGDGFQSQVYSMPVIQYEGIYLGLASIFHEGNRSAADFDCVDCELTYATNPAHFNPVASGQSFISRGSGHYPDGEFDCGCIYAAAPVEIDGKLCFYYMGGNGQHTNFRETVLARAFVEKDKFAYLCQQDNKSQGVLPVSRFRIYGEKLLILAELGEGGSISAAICPNRRIQPYVGYGWEDCVLEPQSDGWLSVSFKKPYRELETKATCIMLKFQNAKMYAIGGDLETESIRY